MKKHKISQDLLIRLECGSKTEIETTLDSIILMENPLLMVSLLMDYRSTLQEILELYNSDSTDIFELSPTMTKLNLIYLMTSTLDEINSLYCLLQHHKNYNDFLIYRDEIIGEQIEMISNIYGRN
jgi:hypothetical protein